MTQFQENSQTDGRTEGWTEGRKEGITDRTYFLRPFRLLLGSNNNFSDPFTMTQSYYEDP